MQTFVNLPGPVASAVSNIISRSDIRAISVNASKLHERYMHPDEEQKRPHIQKPADALAYLSMRFPATYAQIYSALSQIQDRVSNWQPKTLLDIGCGPGTGIWAAKALWPDLQSATGVDRDSHFLSLAEEIAYDAKEDITVDLVPQTIVQWTTTPVSKTYDLIIVANVVNELTKDAKEQLLETLVKRSSGIVLVLEPGTPRGFGVIQSVAEKISPNVSLIAPYIHGTFIASDDYWIHFPQRFIRLDFQRRIRQSMRKNALMASDWEETKFSYVACGNVPVEKKFWGQSVGGIEKYRGYLVIPVLTADGIIKTRVMKRHKEKYAMYKNLRWGELIGEKLDG